MKKISKGMLMAALICGSFSVLNVASAEEMQTFEMDEFVVTASRVATSKVDTPASISVINSETLAEKNYSDVSEALADVPGVNMLGSGAKGTLTGQDSIMINGDTRVLVLIDGRRANLGSSGNSGSNWLPPVEAIERVENYKIIIATPGEIKKFASGNGSAKKEVMIKLFETTHPNLYLIPKIDDIADSYWMSQYIKQMTSI
jgi:outer membrane receptor for ferrienterochelin and colicin